SKLLVPTPPVRMVDEEGRPKQNPDGTYEYYGNGMDPQNIGVFQGMIRSFYDAPGGWREEMREIIYAAGIEYAYRDLFMLRGGAFFENKDKGNRKFAEIGIGLKYNVFNLDVSYLFSFTQHNPLENTLRFTLAFHFDSFYASEIKKQGIQK
ncbi:MAG TPA: PorV/PorQ family protein, partial [Bacteroidales bacterium]|nr:PorV/PorQ family protein [Bacteroidales bacterium]